MSVLLLNNTFALFQAKDLNKSRNDVTFPLFDFTIVDVTNGSEVGCFNSADTFEAGGLFPHGWDNPVNKDYGWWTDHSPKDYVKATIFYKKTGALETWNLPKINGTRLRLDLLEPQIGTMIALYQGESHGQEWTDAVVMDRTGRVLRQFPRVGTFTRVTQRKVAITKGLHLQFLQLV